MVNRVITIKSSLFFLSILINFQLLGMDALVEPVNKSTDYSWIKGASFFAHAMCEREVIPKDVARIIVRTSYMVRMNQLYKKFDPFFHFDNEAYRLSSFDHEQNRKNYFQQNPQCTWENIRHFQRLHLYSSSLCRKFGIIKLEHFLFFTQIQEDIVALLVFKTGTFCYDWGSRGSCSLRFTADEYELFKKHLPMHFRKICSGYPLYVDNVLVPESKQGIWC